MFENVNEVDFHEKDYDRMMAVISKEGEKIMVSLAWTFSDLPITIKPIEHF